MSRDDWDSVERDRVSEGGDRSSERDEHFLDEELIPLLVVGGILLVLFPEPATSALGLVLVGVGAFLWFVELFGRESGDN